jgi:hypothetical protein
VSKGIMVAFCMLSLVCLSGCLWRDDFRDRAQPQLLVQDPRPTLNPDSIDYRGDPLHQDPEIERCTELPDIDGLSEIPEVPEYPAGVELR